jgi:hypothetical protein
MLYKELLSNWSTKTVPIVLYKKNDRETPYCRYVDGLMKIPLTCSALSRENEGNPTITP